MSEISHRWLDNVEKCASVLEPNSENERTICVLVAEIRRLRSENAGLRDQIVTSATSKTYSWDGPAHWWKCECGNAEKRLPNVHAAVCAQCKRQMRPAA